MFRVQKFALLVVLAVLLMAFTVPALAAGPTTVTHETIIDENVHWSMDPSVCKRIQEPLSGNGTRHEEIITQVAADGTVTSIANDVVIGTASDSRGTYNFKYSNHSTDVVPGSGSQHLISMTDSFIVSGHGVDTLNVGFNWSWTYAGTYLDPGTLFPPVTDWVQTMTRGDPLTCDPI